MSIYLIRHGETGFNRDRTIQHPDTPLSDAGRMQAQAVAKRLAGLAIAGIVASDMARASETAAIIGRELRLPVTETPLLRERNFGDWRGLTFSAIGFDPLATGLVPPNGETEEAFRQRIELLIPWIFERRSDCADNLVVVTHGLVIREIARQSVIIDEALGSPESLARTVHLANTAITCLGPTLPLRLTLFACAAHLDGLPVDQSGAATAGGIA